MSKQDKLQAKLERKPPPKDFTWDEWITVARRNGFSETCTSGSHYAFQHSSGFTFTMSKTHPSGVLKLYQIKAALEALDRVRGEKT